MDLLTKALESLILPVLEALLCAVFGYIGIKARGLYVKYVNNREKEAVARIAVQATEQICRELHGKDKLAAALERMRELCAARGVPFDPEEATLLLESAVAAFNRALRDGTANATA